jgi:hypothetical protein
MSIKNGLKVQRIISGGQTGADLGGIAAGLKLGLETGGWAPRGWITEKGPRPELAGLGLREAHKTGYPYRTLLNVENSDGTVIFGDPSSPGSRLTIRYCKEQGKPFLVVEEDYSSPERNQDVFLWWLSWTEIETLNVAGNRESKNPGIGNAVRDYLVKALSPAG